MKQPKQLTPLHHSTKEYEIIGFDTEFCGKHGKFKLGTISYPDGEDKAFTNSKEFIEEILRRKNRSKRFYAHNLSVDLANGVQPYIPDRFYTEENKHPFQVMVVGTRVIKASITDPNRNQWSFYDSSQISGYASLKEIGEIINLEKKEPDLDFTKCICDENISNEMIEYGKRDSRIVTVWMNDHLQPIINDKFNSKLENTLAGTTMGIWRRNYQKEKYYVLDEELRKAIRGAYNGGRTEVFYKGYKDNVKKYDINSLYPFIYVDYYFPHPNNMNIITKPERETFYNHYGKEGFIQAKVKAPDLHIPYLKYFDEDLGSNGKLIFPVGEFKDCWTLLEIRKALDLGYKLLEIDWIIYSNKKCKPWKKFGEDLYNEKQEYGKKNMKSHYWIIKYLLNSLWGRFGVDPNGDKAGYIKYSNDIDEVKSKVNELEIALTGQEADALRNGDLDYWFEKFDDNAPNYCHPEWASYTTACARHELYKWFEKVGLENILYCDTDSILTTKELNKKYISDELGAMDLEFTGGFNAIREKGYILYNSDGSIKEVIGSGLDQNRLGKEKAANALLENKKVKQNIWGGPTFGGVKWGKVEEIEKELGSHYVPKREFYESGKSIPLKKI